MSSPVTDLGPGKYIISALSIRLFFKSYIFLNEATLGFVGLNGVDLSGKTMGLAPLGRNSKLKSNDFRGKYDGASLDYSKVITRYPKPKLLDKNLIIISNMLELI